MSVRRNLVIGLPESGKTTFIAAFWHIVESEDVPSALRVKQLTGDRAYLNRLREAWLRCEPVGKTLPADETIVRMLLEDRASQGTSELLLPDIAGETFNDQWVNRRWTKGFDELVLAADGALIFVHPNEINEPIRIDTVNAQADHIRRVRNDGGAYAPTVAQIVAEPTPTIWNAASAPTQVQLVDLLQFLIWRRAGRVLNLAVVVSAWDLVRGAGRRRATGVRNVSLSSGSFSCRIRRGYWPGTMASALRVASYPGMRNVSAPSRTHRSVWRLWMTCQRHTTSPSRCSGSGPGDDRAEYCPASDGARVPLRS